jgi:LPXTG-motif cell wall-anchored protein
MSKFVLIKYLQFSAYFRSTTFKQLIKTTTYIALFSIVFLTSWAVPQEEAQAGNNWDCNDPYARAYFYKLDWDYVSTSFTIDQYVATETTTIQRTTTTVDFSSVAQISGDVKGINALAMSPTGIMYVTVTSTTGGTDLFTISTEGALTHLKDIAAYQQVGDENFYDGVNGYYGFSAGDYVVNAGGNDQIYLAQAGFEHGYIYNVATGGVTTFADPGMTTPINAADFSYIGNWDGYEMVAYNALANKVVLYDKDNNSISEVTPTNSAFSNVSATLASYSYKTPFGEIRMIVDDGLGNRFEVARTGTNTYNVTAKGSTFTTDNSDGASCGPNAYDPFSPSFKTSLGECVNGYQQPSLLITNNKTTTQYFDVNYRIAGGSWNTLIDGTSISPGGQLTPSGTPLVYEGQTVEYQMRYGTSNPSSGTFYTVGDLKTGSGCGDYAAGTVDTNAGTCVGGSSTPTVTLTSTGTVNAYFDVQYKIGTSGTWTTFINGELVVAGTPETISLPTTVSNAQTVYFQYIVADADPTATSGFVSATSRTISCKTYTGTITATASGSCTNDYVSYTVTLTNTGNTSMYFSHAERRDRGSNVFIWKDTYGRNISAGSTYTYSTNVHHGVVPEFKMVYGTTDVIYRATDLYNSSNTEGTFTTRSYGSYLKSGDSWVRWTADSAVDCNWWGSGGSSTNSSSNYTLISQNTSQICDGTGSATIRLTLTNYNSSIDSYGGYVDVEFSTDNVSWTNVADGQVIADGQALTFNSPTKVATSSTGYFRYRIAESNPTDSTPNASWAVFSYTANCVANFSYSATFSSCSSVGQYSTLTITNNEAQTLYFKAAPSFTSATGVSSSSSYTDYANAITFSVGAGETLTYDADNSPDLRKLYPDGTTGYMFWVVQGSYIANPDWSNTTAYPYKTTNSQNHKCIPDVTASYDVTSCSSAGQTSTLTVTNNEAVTVYFRVQPSKVASQYSPDSANSGNYDSADITTFSVAAGQTFVYTDGAQTYAMNQDAYMFWRIQKSYTASPSWNSNVYPYQDFYTPSSGLSYRHDCDLNVAPTTSTSYQYETEPSNIVNSCVENKQWMGWSLYNSNYSDANRTALWYAFEISLDDGTTWSRNNLFYRTASSYVDNDDYSVLNNSVTGSLAVDGYTSVAATNFINMQQSSSYDYILLSTRATSGSIMKIRYKVAYSESELATIDWVVFGNYGKTVEQRTTNCDPVITTTNWGTATTTDSTNDTYSDLVTIGECQNTLEAGGFATATFTVTRPSGTQYYLNLFRTTDGGTTWSEIESNRAVGTSYSDSVSINHAGTVQYKFKFSYTSGDFTNSQLYYSAVKTVNCPTVGASTASIALGTCVSGGATPSITLGNNGWATGYFHVQYSTDLGTTWEEAFYDSTNSNAVIYKMILPGEVKTYTIQDTISQGTTVVMRFRFASTSPVTSGTFTNTSTLLIDCSTTTVSGTSFTQVSSASSCYNNSQTIKFTYSNSSSSNMYLYYQVKVNNGEYSALSYKTLSGNTTSSQVTLSGTFSNSDIVTIKYRVEKTIGGQYASLSTYTPITIECGVTVGGSSTPLSIVTEYVSCSLYGPDKYEFKVQKNNFSVSSSAYVHFQVEISHNGTTWKPFGQVRYSNDYYSAWYSDYDFSESRNWGGLTGDKANYFGFVRPGYMSSIEYAAGVMLLDSTHEYKIRYRYYTASSTTVDMSYFTGDYTVLTISSDPNCNQNDVQPVTLTTTQLTCLENKGQIEFKFEDTTVTHLDPYREARIFYEYSTNGGVSWVRDISQTDALQNSLIFNLPSQAVLNGQNIKVRWGYVRAHDFYSSSSSYQNYYEGSYYTYTEAPYEYLHTAGLTSNGLYYSRFDDNTNLSGTPSGDFNANFINHVMVNTASVQVDCDPESDYSQTLTTCECNDLGATSTLSITNNDNYTAYYKVQYSLDGGITWQSATDSLESAFDISVSAGSTNTSLSKFVPDGKTIKWRVKDTTNGGDFEGQIWEEVTESATVDCGCAGGSVAINVEVGTCGNGSSTPVINLIPSSSDTAYFTIEYKRNNDTEWQLFKNAEIVSNGLTENHPLEVTVSHGGTIQVRYKVNKVLNNLAAESWNYTDTKTVNCPFTAVTGQAIYTSCAENYRAASFKVTNTSASTAAAKFNVQYKILNSSGTVTDWTNSSIINSVIAPGVSLITTNNLQILEGQKIEWRYESVKTTEAFTGVWIEDKTSEYVNCVIDVTVVNTMGSCDSGTQLATLSLQNNESLNTVYFQVQYTLDNGVTWVLKNSNLAVAPGETDTTLNHSVPHTKNIIWRYKVTNTNNDYTGILNTVLDASPTVNCPVLNGTGSSTFGACTGGERKSTFAFSNSSSANAPAYFYIQYNLSGDSSDWITKVSGTPVIPGTSSTTFVMVPNGQTITWRYYPMSSATTPTSYITETTSDEVNCSLDTVISQTLDSCINNSAISRYVLTNNTSTTVYYQVEYFVQGSTGYVVADTDLTLGAAGSSTQSAEFTQNVASGKYIRWRYKAATSLSGLVSAAYVDYVQSATVNCETIDPSVTTSFGICYNNTKEVKFIIKNSADATTSALFKVQVNVNGTGWVDKPDITLGVDGQYPHTQIVPTGQTVQWRYKVAKNVADLPTDWTNDDLRTITCSSGEDISVTFDTTCDSNGYKTSKLNINNSSSGILYYKAEYSTDGGTNWTLSANQVQVNPGGATFLPESVSEGETITWRYKVSETGNDFSTLNWTTTDTSEIVNCTGVNISTPYTSLGQCVSGSKTAKFHYGTLSSSPAPAYYHIQYRIDGGTWTDKVTASNGVVVSGVSTSTSQSVASGSSIEWRYKAAYSTAALANISFNELSGGAISVDCGSFISVTHQMGTCTNQIATSTLTLNNTGSTPILVTVHSAINSGDWATEVSTVEISAGSQLVLTKSVVNGQTVSWKYKYAGTVTKLAAASETTFGSIPALDCVSEVLNQVSINNVLKACVAGNRVSELTITNNSSETVYVEAWYDTGSGWITKGTSSVINGTPKILEAPGAPHGATVKWRYRLGLSSTMSNDFTTLTALVVDCPQTSSVTTTLAACANQTRDSKLSINNTGTVTQYFKVEYSINNGGYEYFGTVSVPSGQVDNTIYKNLSTGQYITWRYATTTTQNDFSNSSYKYLTRSETVDCTSANLTATQSSTCTPSGTTSVKNSTFTISNGSTNSAQVEIQSSSDNVNWSNVGIQTITNSQPYSVNKVMTTTYVIYRYRIYSSTNQNAWQQVIVMAPVDCSTTTSSVTAYNNNECLNNTPVAKLTIFNPNSTAVVVSYDISINGGSWQPVGTTSVGTTSVTNNFTSSAFSVPLNSTFQWRYKTSAETTYQYVNATAKNCTQVTSINAVPEIVCTDSNNPKARLQIFNTGSQSVIVQYDYKINNGNYQSGGIFSIDPNSPLIGSEIPIAAGDQIVFRYKTTSETQYIETPVKSGVDCGSTPNNPVLIQTISECTANSSVSTVEIRNLSNEVKTFYLETNATGSWAPYDTVTIDATSSLTKTLTVLQNQTVQWRALETSYAQWSLDSPYQVSNIETVNCTPTTTTTVPVTRKYIFEPLISTNRVCDFENGGATFGITVDNSRSNVDAKIVQKIWINTTSFDTQTITIPAGQMVNYSSIDVGENKHLTASIEVTNVENSNVQKLFINKDADCIEDDGNTYVNPAREIAEEEEPTKIIDGDGNHSSMENNTETPEFLIGDDYVEVIYNENADDKFEKEPLTTDPPDLPSTGSNVGSIIITLGTMLMAAGALILRKSFRY